ncbi:MULTISPECIES: hypothetical protein [unclassified Psychrobacillus]|uniref:hypothetical protein n=1 Tax=unclassified Psychrobacillus TaxID=2636677 RepID=UPI0030FC841E
MKEFKPTEKDEEAMLSFTMDAFRTPGFFKLSQKEQMEIAMGYLKQSRVTPIKKQSSMD